MKILINLFAAIGLCLTITLLVGIVLDYRDFDPTKGGYQPPYENFTGEPIDWSKADITATGIAKRGRIINVLVNGTTGMIHFQILGQKIKFRKLSERAIKVHKPREAFIKLGFKPEF